MCDQFLTEISPNEKVTDKQKKKGFTGIVRLVVRNFVDLRL